jgi:hypothetical protein
MDNTPCYSNVLADAQDAVGHRRAVRQVSCFGKWHATLRNHSGDINNYIYIKHLRHGGVSWAAIAARQPPSPPCQNGRERVTTVAARYWISCRMDFIPSMTPEHRRLSGGGLSWLFAAQVLGIGLRDAACRREDNRTTRRCLERTGFSGTVNSASFRFVNPRPPTSQRWIGLAISVALASGSLVDCLPFRRTQNR